MTMEFSLFLFTDNQDRAWPEVSRLQETSFLKNANICRESTEERFSLKSSRDIFFGHPVDYLVPNKCEKKTFFLRNSQVSLYSLLSERLYMREIYVRRRLQARSLPRKFSGAPVGVFSLSPVPLLSPQVRVGRRFRGAGTQVTGETLTERHTR